ncbi:hypothetical protein B566_EDAN002078 [Ephemera danica]|nr:hypothetical protein B566_EDAN002078 [Ephemera danica]
MNALKRIISYIPGTKLTIEKGTAIVIPNFGLHDDSQYFPNPEEFIPERLSDEEMAKENQYIYLPFEEGPRLCIKVDRGFGVVLVMTVPSVLPGVVVDDTDVVDATGSSHTKKFADSHAKSYQRLF